MRLWHYKIIPYLPKSQLIAQWRELNSIYRYSTRNIIINYIYEYPKEDLLIYSLIVMREMENRNFKINSYDNFKKYFSDINIVETEIKSKRKIPFVKHHTNRYLNQCFFNLQEKFDRKQKDFSKTEYKNLCSFVKYQNECIEKL